MTVDEVTFGIILGVLALAANVVVFGAIFTPPDVISQFMLAVPMYILFELGLLFSNEKKA